MRGIDYGYDSFSYYDNESNVYKRVYINIMIFVLI